jgi:aquaporin TIP
VPGNWLKTSVAEAIGTFALCFVGVLAISAARVANAPAGVANLASIGLAHGLTIMVMIAAMGAVSGGHFNPAVTFGFVTTGRMPIVTGLVYWTAQLLGASLAGLLNVAFVGSEAVANGTPDLGRG